MFCDRGSDRRRQTRCFLEVLSAENGNQADLVSVPQNLALLSSNIVTNRLEREVISCSQLLWEHLQCRFGIAVVRIEFEGLLKFLLSFLQISTLAER